jgi:hypothetical protein
MGRGESLGVALRARIEEAVADGASLRQIEEQILAGAPQSADARDALWLFAWGLVERDDALIRHG